MSTLPTNIIDNDPGHTAGHNAANAQVNINSRPATVDTVTHSSAGTLALDAEDGHTVIVDVDEDITEITIANLDIGLPMSIIFVGGGSFTIDLSLFEAYEGKTLPAAQPIILDAIKKVTFVLLPNGAYWAWDSLLDFAASAATPEEIDVSDLYINIDPDDISTWGRDRTYGQWIIAGNRFNAGSNADNIGPALSGSDADGYNLTFNTAGDTVDGFTMDDAQTERIKPGVVGSISVVELATQYDEDGSYTYQAGPPGNNTAISRPPSDPLWFDRTMCGLDILDSGFLFNVGPGGDVIRLSAAFVVESWMTSADLTNGPFELNTALGEAQGSPIRMSIQDGDLTVITRDSTVALTTSDPTPSTESTPVVWTLPSVGQWAAFILDVLLDPGGAGYPGGGAGYMDLHSVNNSTGALTLEDSAPDDEFGWVYEAAEGKNDEFWLSVMRFANAHNTSVPGVTNNWDAVGGNARHLKFATVAVTNDSAITVAQHADHLRAKLGLPKP